MLGARVRVFGFFGSAGESILFGNRNIFTESCERHNERTGCAK